MHSTLTQCRATQYRTVRVYNQAVLLLQNVFLLVMLVISVRLVRFSWSVSYQTIAEPHAHIEEDHDSEGWVQRGGVFVLDHFDQGAQGTHVEEDQ